MHFKNTIQETEMKRRLTRDEYLVLREGVTEAPYTGSLLYADTAGLFTCKACGNPIFDSSAKFNSGTGWPSFDEALPERIEYVRDLSNGMRRIGVQCAQCHSHLGHLFHDGPTATGKRYCINSISMDMHDQ